MTAIGQSIPNVSLAHATVEGPAPLSSQAYFAGKKTVLFAVPGAFTPTCSAKHLPGFVENVSAFKAKGVDQIACMSVNDAFVMAAWGASADAMDTVDMLADGNGDLTRALDLEFDATGFGMGKRSQRFAMIVDDGKITQLFVEEPGAFEVSSADYVLGKL